MSVPIKCPFCGSRRIQTHTDAVVTGFGPILTRGKRGQVVARFFNDRGESLAWSELNAHELFLCNACTAEFDGFSEPTKAERVESHKIAARKNSPPKPVYS